MLQRIVLTARQKTAVVVAILGGGMVSIPLVILSPVSKPEGVSMNMLYAGGVVIALGFIVLNLGLAMFFFQTRQKSQSSEVAREILPRRFCDGRPH